MNESPDRPRVRVSSVAGLLATIPHLLGFTPDNSLVVVGVTRADRVQAAFRYDLPDPPDSATAAEITGHVLSVLARHHLTVVAIGYGPGRLVTPLADALIAAAPSAGLWLRDVLRVEGSRYWSYLCKDPGCCPAEGVLFDPSSHPVSAALTAAGLLVLPGRDALAATIASVTGADAEVMRQATQQAERAARRLMATGGWKAVERAGLTAIRASIGLYRDGGPVLPAIGFAWLALVLTRLRIRDDAWARMDPGYREAHRRLWTDLVRRAQPGYAAAPASLLALTAWQCGDGALANLAIDRALADTPGYSMALLLRSALDAGAPPSAAVPPLTSGEVTASYTDPSDGPAGPDAPAAGAT